MLRVRFNGSISSILPHTTDLLLQPPIVASYLKKNKIQASRCRHFVVDEADELIASDAVQHIHAIYGRLVAANHGASQFDRLQVCFFSATLDTPEVRQLAGEICHDPFWVNLRGGGTHGDSVFPDTVQHCVVRVSPETFDSSSELVMSDAVHRRGKLDRPASLGGLSKEEANSEKIKQLKFRAVLAVLDAFSMDQVLIFCRTNLDCDLMETYLKSQASRGKGLVDKYSCRVLAGMRSMQDRQKALEDFKGGESRILIATDVAARGIDIRELPFVINVTLPSSAATYVHRCGRVGRADRMGLAVSLVGSVKEKVWFCQPGKKPPCDDTRDYRNGGTALNTIVLLQKVNSVLFSDFTYVVSFASTGNCIWYDEPALWGDIETLFNENDVVASMLEYPALTLRPQIQRFVEHRGYGNVAEEVESDAETKKRMDLLQYHITRLQALEDELQVDYWSLRSGRVTTT